jgi:hypothetical protein
MTQRIKWIEGHRVTRAGNCCLRLPKICREQTAAIKDQRAARSELAGASAGSIRSSEVEQPLLALA